ncbi:MAG: hypothetical protein LBN33_11340 [Desulfovibrio sp.]|nr:hypothetical protein [Desulfovibrio sp.]
MNGDILGSRLRNCLVTILELQEDLERTHLGLALQTEFSVLREVVKHLEYVNVEEQDVCRIEAATGRFLAELRENLNRADVNRSSATRLLQ